MDNLPISWVQDPDLIAAAIKALVHALLWLCGIVGSLGTIALVLLGYIDRQRMKKIDQMAINIETIANTLTANSITYEHRLTTLESGSEGLKTEIIQIRALCDRRVCGVP